VTSPLAIYCGTYWKIDAADWSRDPDEESFILRPAGLDAELRIDCYDYGKHSTWQVLLENARRRAPQGTPIEEVSCGQFAGLHYDYTDVEGDYRREWLLGLAELVLLVTYSCNQEHKARDRAEVDRLLSTLADARA
jgi:hypothetical protein